MKKEGSLIIAGSGIRGSSQVTLETAAWTREADLVMYWVADPATEAWIREQNPNCFDMGSLYREREWREAIYQRIAACIMAEVRSGKTVCAVYYGHPGVFTASSHQAVAMARAEGYRVAMLPGVSAEDCLCAEIGFDPSTHGCQSLEATDLLLRRRPLLTDSHVIIWQIAHVGSLDYSRYNYDTSRLPLLIDYLEQFYRPDHGVFHYQGSRFAVDPSSIEYVSLADMRTVRATSISTLYIPPATERPTDPEMAEKLGMSPPPHAPSSDAPPAGQAPASERIGREEEPPRPKRRALAAFLNRLGQEPRLLAAFRLDPKRTVAREAELNSRETEALLSGDVGSIWQAMTVDDDSHTPSPGNQGEIAPSATAAKNEPLPERSTGTGTEADLGAAIPQPSVTKAPRQGLSG